MKKLPFHKRFGISLDLSEVQRRFVNRTKNHIFDGLFQHDIEEKTVRSRVLWRVANDLGEEYDWNQWFDDYIEDDYQNCLRALEAAYSGLGSKKHRNLLNRLIRDILDSSEIDLSIEWRDGIFLPKGAKILDTVLINDNLDWLAEQKFENVYKPFEKALRHFLASRKRPELRFDVVTDMYEALECICEDCYRAKDKRSLRECRIIPQQGEAHRTIEGSLQVLRSICQQLSTRYIHYRG
jgi:hypothetical protein